ncbi:MAG: chromate transporter [Clostridiales bacterium]|nr:chromate transporter [Clostridiales bacterium]
MEKKKIGLLFELFFTFFKLGAFTFGGGYAMLPLMQREIVEKHSWLKDDEILDILAVSQSTPGPLAVNMATFVGYKTAGFSGSFFATLGLVIPSFVVILLISTVLTHFQDYKVVKYAFNGIRAGVLALITKSFFTMAKQCPKEIFSYLVLAVSFAVSVIWGANALVIIASCAVVGLVFSIIQRKRGKAQ